MEKVYQNTKGIWIRKEDFSMANSIVINAKYILADLYIRFFQLFHPVGNQVTFVSFNGMQYSDNPRAISEKLHEMNSDYEIVWLFKDAKNYCGLLPDYIRAVEYTGKNLWQEVSKSKAFVTNCEININFVKRYGQVFIQTWHGDICFKKMLLEVDENLPVFDARYTDLCISGSEFGKNRYKSVFNYYGEVLNVGSPRNDILFRNDEEEKIEVKKELDIDTDTKVLLFAPTFRDSNKQGLNVYFDINKVLRQFESKTKQRWICLIRAHVGTSISECENTLDVTSYQDMARILLITDFLISDYSSCATDFIIKDKPIILCQFDCSEYEKNDRKLEFDSKEAGFIVAKTSGELYMLIDDLTEDAYKESNRKVWDYFKMNETGRASESVVKRIIYE